MGDIVLVTTRYFGGTKLGKGGLVRAYSGSVKKALAGLAVKDKREMLPLTVTLDYANITVAKQVISSFHSEIIEENYEAGVSLRIKLPKDDENRFIRAITDLTGGRVEIIR